MVLVNFGASHGFEHGTRTLFTEPFLRAVGDRMTVDATKDDLSIPPEQEYDRLMWEQTQKRHNSSYYSIQWDSWRFWEGLAAGCLVFNIDLDYYGVQLPVMPVNGTHYVGLRLDRMQLGVDEILSNPARMEAIAIAGREWAMEHYSPVAMAKRFLQMVEDKIDRRP